MKALGALAHLDHLHDKGQEGGIKARIIIESLLKYQTDRIR